MLATSRTRAAAPRRWPGMGALAPLDAAFARVDSAYPWDPLILSCKFHPALDLAPVLGKAIVEACAGGDAGAAATIVLPVPLVAAPVRARPQAPARASDGDKV